MKKLLLFMLGVLAAFPGISRDFTYEYEGQTLTYTVLDEDAKTCETKRGSLLSAGNKVSGALVIPSIAKDGDIEYTVTTLGDRSFDDCSGLTSVTIPNSVTTIGEHAFSYCSGLTSVTIPNSVTTIGEFAFYYCSGLTSVIIPNSVKKIGSLSFNSCSGLKKAAYPSNLSHPFGKIDIIIKYPAEGAIIEDGFIYGPEKTAIYFAPLSLEGEFEVPASVKTIGEHAFTYCEGLTAVKAANTVAPVMNDNSFDGLYATVQLSVPVDFSTSYLVSNWALFENIHAGDTGKVLGTYTTGNLKYRLTPSTTEGGKNMAVVIPGDYSSLTEVTIPERFTVPENGTNTRYYVDAVGYHAFNGYQNLTTITFNSKNAATMIGDYAFAGTNISAITIPATVNSIGNHAFDGCSLIAEITVPASVKTIGDYAFYNTNVLTDVRLNEGLETIGKYAFGMNSSSTKRSDKALYMPSTLKSIGSNAFSLSYWNKVNISDIKAWCGIDLADDRASPIFNSNSVCINDEYISELNIPEGVREIKPYVFYGCNNLTSVTFPEGLQSIGQKAFSCCGKLTSVTFPEGLQSIGYGAFNYDNMLTTISIPGSVTFIGQSAFSAPNPTLSFEYGSAPIEFAKNSFKSPVSLTWERPMEGLNLNVTSLESLTIGNSVTEIPEAKFKGVSSLSSLTLGSGLTTIGAEAFSGCSALTEVIVPPSVETIGASAFSGNTKLSSIIMGHNVKNIGENAFYQCPAQTVSITAQTPPAAYDNSFSNYTGNLYVQGQAAASAYSEADFCWYQFEGHVMIEATEMRLEGNKSISGKPGDTFQLTATLYPENVTLPQVFWRSTNPDIATVDANGLVTILCDPEELMAMAEDMDVDAEVCKIIAESLYADGPVVEVSVSKVTSGISDVISEDAPTGEIDFNAPVEVYNIQGVMVGNSLESVAPGIYIVRQGSCVKKIVVK